ncbi:hypothetical protein QBC44DRAFT_309259 [Cladorrhinum sp. PSN332]|nr:hypothetical protein QBC44DRAFT_309259 [Cladorrhinum sp. PSN332]
MPVGVGEWSSWSCQRLHEEIASVLLMQQKLEERGDVPLHPPPLPSSRGCLKGKVEVEKEKEWLTMSDQGAGKDCGVCASAQETRDKHSTNVHPSKTEEGARAANYASKARATDDRILSALAAASVVLDIDIQATGIGKNSHGTFAEPHCQPRTMVQYSEKGVALGSVDALIRQPNFQQHPQQTTTQHRITMIRIPNRGIGDGDLPLHYRLAPSSRSAERIGTTLVFIVGVFVPCCCIVDFSLHRTVTSGNTDTSLRELCNFFCPEAEAARGSEDCTCRIIKQSTPEQERHHSPVFATCNNYSDSTLARQAASPRKTQRNAGQQSEGSWTWHPGTLAGLGLLRAGCSVRRGGEDGVGNGGLISKSRAFFNLADPLRGSAGASAVESGTCGRRPALGQAVS